MTRNIKLLLLLAGIVLPVSASVYTSSAAYDAATTAGYQTVVDETYGTLSLQDISSGTTLDGITYSNFVGGYSEADITDDYNALDTTFFYSLGADNTGGDPTSASTFFFAGQSITATFSSPVYAASAFFNVNLNSGSYGFTTNTGDTALTGSASFDTLTFPYSGTDTFVFAGITSATPFTSITLFSTDPAAGVFNVAEIEAAATPEPSFYVLLGIGLVALAFGRQFRRSRLNA
jgi:hypothetical protein